jgi:hypothetical protein
MESHTNFLKHLQSIEFEEGVDRGKWGVAGDPQLPEWPNVILWVSTSKLSTALPRYFIKLELTNYPITAPAGSLWDIENNQQLSYGFYPKGDVSVTNVFLHQPHIYAPCDRNNNHPDWLNHPDYGEFFWKPEHTIVNYLKFIYHVLQSAK